MWKKKRYDIHIRLTPEEIEALHFGAYAITDIAQIFNPINCKHKSIPILNQLVWKIHNKCVEINKIT